MLLLEVPRGESQQYPPVAPAEARLSAKDEATFQEIVVDLANSPLGVACDAETGLSRDVEDTLALVERDTLRSPAETLASEKKHCGTGDGFWTPTFTKF